MRIQAGIWGDRGGSGEFRRAVGRTVAVVLARRRVIVVRVGVLDVELDGRRRVVRRTTTW